MILSVCLRRYERKYSVYRVSSSTVTQIIIDEDVLYTLKNNYYLIKLFNNIINSLNKCVIKIITIILDIINYFTSNCTSTS